MNNAQVLHARSIARHVATLATALATRMNGIEKLTDKWLLDCQPSVLESIFNEVPNQAAGISAVIFDMLPRLADMTPFAEPEPDESDHP